jgi:hypothetical protein
VAPKFIGYETKPDGLGNLLVRFSRGDLIWQVTWPSNVKARERCGSGTKAPDEKEPDFAHMSDAEFQREVDKALSGKAGWRPEKGELAKKGCFVSALVRFRGQSGSEGIFTSAFTQLQHCSAELLRCR